MSENTHFGYRDVPVEEKSKLVREVFDSVASRYDLMNDLMSFGLHRLWKRFTLELTHLRSGQRALDLAGGTGDIATAMARRVGRHGTVVLSDINASMLNEGRRRQLNRGITAPLHYVQADAEHLPFADGHFDCVTIGFGLRNVTHKDKALAEMYRVLRPGGQALVLEFSHPNVPGLNPLYDAYSFTMLPLIGRLVTGDADSYRYLAESIRKHPDQETMAQMMGDAGFERCCYHNLTGGIVALHRGHRL